MSTNDVYRAKDLVREYRMGGSQLRVLDGVSLEVAPGEVLAILGRSGAGKSTLLHLLGLLDVPSSGTLSIGDQDLTRLSSRQRCRLRNETFGFIFQFYHLLPEFSALGNVLMPAMVQSSVLGWWSRRKAARARAEELLERVGLKERMTHRPSQLSGGERQRVAIARALMNRPRVVFCDEPTGNLDRTTASRVEAQLWELAGTLEQSFVIVTHDDAMAARAGRMLHLVDGRLVDTPPEDTVPLPA